MQGFDRTGTSGLGQRTGNGMGPCGRGFSRGRRGSGRFFDSGTYQAGITKQSELEMLEDSARELERELESVRERARKLRGE